PQRGFFSPAKDIILPETLVLPRQTAKITSVAQIADAIKSFELQAAPGALQLAAYNPGAHIDVHLPDGPTRQYSLCEPDNGFGKYRIAVKREEHGRGGSKAMHTLSVGDEIEIGLPRNNFPLDISAKKTLLLAGGIGITPLWCMAHALSAAGGDFHLAVFARSRKEMAFNEEMAKVSFADKVSTAFDDQGADVPAIVRETIGAYENGYQLYVCGPPGFMELVMRTAKDLNWPNSNVFSEAFASAEIDQTKNEPFEVELARSGKTLQVDAHEFLIDVLHQNGVAVPCSCTQGICGSCITSVLDGEVEHRDAILSDEVRANNSKMTVCVSRAKGKSIRLDL
ncbi:MAG: PDR/VanB family oxidoreductase, partial [Pseudomonadota bacterium]